MEHHRSTDPESGESRFNKWFDMKVVATVTLITLVNYFLSPVNDLKIQQALLAQKIDTLQNNHLSHIADDIKELKAKDSVKDNEIKNIETSMSQMLIILEQLKK